MPTFEDKTQKPRADQLDYEALMLKNQVGFPIYLCAKEIAGKYAELLADMDLTYTQYVVLLYFWEYGSSNLKTLSDKLLLDPSTLTPILKKLERKGYLKRDRSAADARNLTVTLTEAGLALREQVLWLPGEMMECIDLTVEEWQTLFHLAHKVLKNITLAKEREQ